MKADRFTELLKRPELLDHETLEELNEILEEFPYFQAAHLLLTLNLKKEKDSRYYSSIRKTACYMGDRRMLFYHAEKDFLSLLEKFQEKKEASDNSFQLIDFFLSQEMKSPDRVPDSALSADLLSVDYLSYSLQEETLHVKDSSEEIKPLKHQEAIDIFLAKEQQAPLRIELRDPEETSENEVFPDLDVVEEGSFFSETLAKIYLKQKKYEKALEIIRKLNLIYPEKNRYFADQIRFLEKLIINAKK